MGITLDEWPPDVVAELSAMACALVKVAGSVTPAVMEQLNVRADQLLSHLDGDAPAMAAYVLARCGLAADPPEGVTAEPSGQEGDHQPRNTSDSTPQEAEAPTLAPEPTRIEGPSAPQSRLPVESPTESTSTRAPKLQGGQRRRGTARKWYAAGAVGIAIAAAAAWQLQPFSVDTSENPSREVVTSSPAPDAPQPSLGSGNDVFQTASRDQCLNASYYPTDLNPDQPEIVPCEDGSSMTKAWGPISPEDADSQCSDEGRFHVAWDARTHCFESVIRSWQCYAGYEEEDTIWTAFYAPRKCRGETTAFKHSSFPLSASVVTVVVVGTSADEDHSCKSEELRIDLLELRGLVVCTRVVDDA
jgi:hypothetical protein